VESEHAEKVPVDADKPVANGSALDEAHEVITSTAGPAPEEPSPIEGGAKAVTTLTPTVEAAHVAVAQVAPDPQEVEWASEEQFTLTPEPQAPKPKEPVTTAQVEVPAEVTPTAVENGVSTLEAKPSKEETFAAGEGAKVAAGPEPEPAVPVVEPIPEPAKVEEASATAGPEAVPATEPEEEVTTVLESPEPAHSLAPPPAVEQDSAPAESTPIPAAEPAEPAVDAASGPEPDTKSSDARSSPLPTAPAINGHTKSMSTASTSTAVPSLPTTATRKASRKFSFPGRDKSGNSSPTGSSRFSSQQKREKRHSLLGKLKEIFGDKEKKEKEKSTKA